jgi:hypothetical protein
LAPLSCHVAKDFIDLFTDVNVLRTERDFYELAAAYLRRAAAENVKHVEMQFDPQGHTIRWVVGWLSPQCVEERKADGLATQRLVQAKNWQQEAARQVSQDTIRSAPRRYRIFGCILAWAHLHASVTLGVGGPEPSTNA